MIGSERIQFGTRNVSNPTACQRNNAVVHLPKDCHVQIAEIAGDEEGDDLPLAIFERLVASRPALDNDMHVVRPLAFH
jgi:hypothetical protein